MTVLPSRRVIAGRRLVPTWRRLRIVFDDRASALLVLAGLRRLQQSEAEFPLRGGGFPYLRRQRWNPTIGGIDDQRGARADMLDRQEFRIVGPGHVALRATFRPPVAGEHRGPGFV